jgi:hypothetical protein
MEEKRSIRVLHQGNPNRQLAHHEAVLYLATRELPERVILVGATPDYIEMYGVSSDEQKQIMRVSHGHLTVACGHVVHHEAATPGSVRFPAWDGWEAIEGLAATITPFDPEANVVTGGGDIALSIGGKPRSVDESQALLRVMAVATGIAASAQIQVYTQFVVTN